MIRCAIALLLAVTPSLVTAKAMTEAAPSWPRGSIQTIYVPAYIVDGLPVLVPITQLFNGRNWVPLISPAPPVPKRQRRME